MATNPQGDNISKTVSMETAMWSAAEARQIALGFRSFSAYVQSLLRKDLQDRPDIILSEKSGISTTHPRANELNENAAPAPRKSKTNSGPGAEDAVESAAQRVATAALAGVRRESGWQRAPTSTPASPVQYPKVSPRRRKN